MVKIGSLGTEMVEKEKRWENDSGISTSRCRGATAVENYPLREVRGGYVHVPWGRGDIAAFTNEFPRLMEKPVEWYKQVDRFVKISKVLWVDLNTLFDIVVPGDLWAACKIAIEWPTEEPDRDATTNGSLSIVMRKYDQEITWLQLKVAPKDVDWVKIERTVQEPKETVYEYYERLLQAFKQCSGLDTLDPNVMSQFSSKFVTGLRSEISLMIQQHLIFWQSRDIDELLIFARYCSDEIDLKHKKLKDKLMLV